jgi:hypothetical protein
METVVTEPQKFIKKEGAIDKVSTDIQFTSIID